jgi:hypothetical protein
VHGQAKGSGSLAHLTVIFAQGDIASPMQVVFNGSLPSDKGFLIPLEIIEN